MTSMESRPIGQANDQLSQCDPALAGTPPEVADSATLENRFDELAKRASENAGQASTLVSRGAGVYRVIVQDLSGDSKSSPD